MTLPSECTVLIIGAGVAGSSTAYRLSQLGVQGIVVIDSGCIGMGSTVPTPVPSHASGTKEVSFEHGRKSGTAVLPSPSVVKMMIQHYSSTSKGFIEHHGFEGARKYLKLSGLGLQFQKEMAKVALPVNGLIKECGSLAIDEDSEAFREEFAMLKELGLDRVEWWESEKLMETPGYPKSWSNMKAIYFPDDAVIDSTAYAKGLLRLACETGNVTVFENVSSVVTVETSGGSAITELLSGVRIRSEHTVVATGGMFLPKQLAGILNPCWSYIVGVPHPDLKDEDIERDYLDDGTPLFSPNMFPWDWDVEYDWCWTGGQIRVSGEDGFSAMKPPRDNERAEILANWVHETYPEIFTKEDTEAYETSYGIYSTTPDLLPIVGHAYPESRICFLVGCNACAQTVMSYCSGLIPALLGYATFTEEEKDILSLVTIRRFSLHPSLQQNDKPKKYK